MVRTEGDIVTALWRYVMSSILPANISGRVYKSTDRPVNSTKEDIVIKPLANLPKQKQEGFINVNIYVPDIMDEGQYNKDGDRCDLLERVAVEVLEVFDVEDIRFTLDTQHTLEVEQAHLINNKILFNLINE